VSNGLFDDFDAGEIAAITRAREAELHCEGEARATKVAHRMQLRRAKGEAALATLLPERLADGDSYHVISSGDVDALSYLAHLLKATHFDYVALSTWCIARPDLDQIAGWLDTGRIDRFELYAGEIFPSQYGDEYEQMLKLAIMYDCRLVVAKNHSKVTLASNEADAYYLVMESSANVNTNPRIEQTAVHASRPLFEFYRDFFHGLKSIDRASKGT
jgi:hypothetical protein